MKWPFRARRLRAFVILVVVAVLLATAGVALTRRRADDAFAAVVRRGTLVVRLTEPGILKPAESITYRSPIEGRELEVVALAPEGTRVNEGDLVARLDTTPLQLELERAIDALRQARIDRQVTDAEWQDARGAVDALADGEGVLSLEEAQSELRLAERKVERSRTEYESLKPLLDLGYITREELERSAFELEQADAAARLGRRRLEVFQSRKHPREQQRAALQLAQREAERNNAAQKANDTDRRVQALRAAIESCSIYARRPGLVVYEDYLASSPRRKIWIGDRVTPSQGLVTIPDLNRMLIESSVREKDVHRVHPGLKALVGLDAFPSLRLSGRVKAVGALARSSVDRPLDEKRFDVTVELGGGQPDLRPEMTARVDILVAERQDVLLVPVNALFNRRGATVAHVIHPWGLETREVRTGESNEEEVEVLAALRVGDRVSLVDVPPAGASEAGSGSRAGTPTGTPDRK